MPAELEAANADLRGFARSLAHDLRGPIVVVNGFSDMLERSLAEPVPERARYLVGRIRSTAKRMDEFTEGLLSLARVSQAELRRETVELGQLAADIVEQFRDYERDRKAIVTIGAGLVVRGDPLALLRMALETCLATHGNSRDASTRPKSYWRVPRTGAGCLSAV